MEREAQNAYEFIPATYCFPLQQTFLASFILLIPVSILGAMIALMELGAFS